MSITPVLDFELTQSNCGRRQVAAMVTLGPTVLSTGHNALPEGDCRLGDCPRGRASFEEIPSLSSYDGNCVAVHAEVMALNQLAANGWTPDLLTNAVMSVTYSPCEGCLKAIRKAGIHHVVTV